MLNQLICDTTAEKVVAEYERLKREDTLARLPLVGKSLRELTRMP